MATKAKGITQGELLCAQCGTASGMEIIGPPKISYSRFDSVKGVEYSLRIEMAMFCTNCDTAQKLMIVEDKEGIKIGPAPHEDTVVFQPVMDWPKQMEADAITWAMELEGRK